VQIDQIQKNKTKGMVIESSLQKCETYDSMLLLLNTKTWTSDHKKELVEDVVKAMRMGMHIICAHEAPGLGDDTVSSRNACPFELMFDVTPKFLSSGDANLYKTIAIPLKGEQWREPGLVLLADKIAKLPDEPCELSEKLEKLLDDKLEKIDEVFESLEQGTVETHPTVNPQRPEVPTTAATSHRHQAPPLENDNAGTQAVMIPEQQAAQVAEIHRALVEIARKLPQLEGSLESVETQNMGRHCNHAEPRRQEAWEVNPETILQIDQLSQQLSQAWRNLGTASGSERNNWLLEVEELKRQLLAAQGPLPQVFRERDSFSDALQHVDSDINRHLICL